MSDFLKIFEAKALAEALTLAGHDVSERTVQRWKKGETKPKTQDIRAIRELVGATLPDATKKPRPDEPDGAMSAWIERWDSDVAPKWAQGLAETIVGEVKALRETTMEDTVQALFDRVEAAERAKRTRASSAPGTESPTASTPEPPAPPKP